MPAEEGEVVLGAALEGGRHEGEVAQRQERVARGQLPGARLELLHLHGLEGDN